MIPSAGLYLPETLHRRERPTSSQMESEKTRPKYFQRKPGQPKIEAREAEMPLPSGLDILPPETNDIFSSITTAFHFADFVFTSSRVSSESHALACLIDRVRKDVSEASRLYLSPRISNFLEAWPDKKSWIDSILIDVRQSLNEIGSYMETFRVAGDDGGAAGLKRRFEWIAGHQKRLMNKQQLLSTCHQSLVTAINTMQTVELCGVTNMMWEDPIFEAPVQPWRKTDDAHVLRGPYSRREYRMSQKNLSISSMYLPQPDEDDVETRSVNSIPVELHGSTPDEIANSNDSNLPASSNVRNSLKRASFHRSYFAKTFNDPTLYTPPLASSIPELEHLQIHSSTEHTLAPSSSDQSLPTPPTPPNTRKSLGSTRPHSHPEQSQNYARPALRARPSSDFGQILPTVAEKTIERNDSTMSTTAVVSVPQVARRYHANPIYIHKHTDRRTSMPSVLPHVRSQSSLTEDLAAWMTTVHSEKLGSAEWDAGSGVSSPSMSVVSCPAIMPALVYTEHAHDDVTGSAQNGDLAANVTEQRRDVNPFIQNGIALAKDTTTSSRDNIPASLRTPRDEAINTRSCAASIHSTSSSIISRKPLPPTATTPPWIQTTPPTPILSSRFVDTTVYTPYRPSPPVSPPETIHDTELSLLQQNMLHQTYVPAIEMPAALVPQETTASIAELSCHNTIRRKKSVEPPTRPSVAEYVSELSCHTTIRRKAATEVPKPIPAQPAAEPVAELSCHNTIRRKDGLEIPRRISAAELPRLDKTSREEAAEVPKPISFVELPSQNTTSRENMRQSTSAATSVSELACEDKKKVDEVPKPMSAQAKRRAAHRRRMELDFGSGKRA